MIYDVEIQEELDKRFKGKDHISSTVVPDPPMSPEREYIRLMNSLMYMVRKEVLAELPSLERDYNAEFRADGIANLDVKLTRLFTKIAKKLDLMIRAKDFAKMLRTISRHGQSISVAQWKREVRRMLGVDISEDYYKGKLMDSLLADWVEQNVNLIKTIPLETLGEMKRIIMEGYKKGMATKEISKEIQSAYGIGKRHSHFIARDQMAKLNAAMRLKEHQDAGVRRFKWLTVGDQRVRESHRKFNRHIYEYANPPINERGEPVIPGTDYNCRCVALPVFEPGLSLPIEQKLRSI